jgi:hypothetical protein
VPDQNRIRHDRGRDDKKLRYRLAEFLHVGAGVSAPPEFVRLRLCRDVYHCTPTELFEQPWHIVQEDLVMLDVEAQAAERARNR